MLQNDLLAETIVCRRAHKLSGSVKLQGRADHVPNWVQGTTVFHKNHGDPRHNLDLVLDPIKL